MASPFVQLHTHSSYSPMSGVPTLEALCQAVRTQGQDTLALTDTNGLYGAIRFLDVARAAGLKAILGAELRHDTHRAVLLAQTPAGYANLCRILSARHGDTPFDFVDTVARHRTGLVILPDDFPALTAWRPDSTETTITRYFPHLTHAIRNTRVIADQCDTEWDFKETIFPSFRRLSTTAAFETLREKTYQGAGWRYGTLSEVVTQRIERN